MIAARFPILPASRRGELSNALPAMKQRGICPVIINDAFLPNVFREERIQIWYGGSGSGKSDAKATELLLKCIVKDYCRVMFCRKVFDSIRMSQFQLFKDVIKRNGFDEFFNVTDHNMRIVCARNGARRLAAVLPEPAFFPFFTLLPDAILS